MIRSKAYPRITAAAFSPFLALFSFIPASSSANELGTSPLKIERGQAWVDVTLDGGTQRLSFDTGASVTAIKADSSSEKYRVVGSSTGQGIGGKNFTCDDVIPQIVTLGSIERRDFKLRRCGPEFGFGGHGLLGIDYLKDKILVIHFSTKQLAELDACPSNLAEVPLHQLPSGQITIETTLLGEQYWGVFDTGWQGPSAIDASIIEKNPKAFRLVSNETIVDPAGGRTQMRRYRFPGTLTIGTKKITNAIFVAQRGLAQTIRKMSGAANDETSLIIGTQILMQADWLLDLKNMKAAEIPR